jgi:hypothetical protein
VRHLSRQAFNEKADPLTRRDIPATWLVRFCQFESNGSLTVTLMRELPNAILKKYLNHFIYQYGSSWGRFLFQEMSSYAAFSPFAFRLGRASSGPNPVLHQVLI